MIIRYDSEGGAGLIERMALVDESGNVSPSPKRFGFTVRSAKNQLDELISEGYEEYCSLGAQVSSGATFELGEIMP